LFPDHTTIARFRSRHEDRRSCVDAGEHDQRRDHRGGR
jgi:hypothetical protein